MDELEIGQVLSLKIRFNNEGLISSTNHPYLILKISDEEVEIAQFDSLKNKMHKALYKSNKVVLHSKPTETVIDEDSFIQMDNTYVLEKYNDLVKYRRQKDKLSPDKLASVIESYNDYRKHHVIDDNKSVYMSKAEIEYLNY